MSFSFSRKNHTPPFQWNSATHMSPTPIKLGSSCLRSFKSGDSRSCQAQERYSLHTPAGFLFNFYSVFSPTLSVLNGANHMPIFLGNAFTDHSKYALLDPSTFRHSLVDDESSSQQRFRKQLLPRDFLQLFRSCFLSEGAQQPGGGDNVVSIAPEGTGPVLALSRLTR